MNNRSPQKATGAWSRSELDSNPAKTANLDTAAGAFTLVELLVVIGIVAVLAVLILVAIAYAKGMARRIQCASNLHQVGIGLNQFVGDYHVYPLFLNPDSRNGAYREHDGSWLTAIERTGLGGGVSHGGNPWYHRGVWHCPSAYRPSSFPARKGFMDYDYNGFGLSGRSDRDSLGLGGHVGFGGSGGYSPPVGASEVLSPSDMMAVGDGFEGENGVIKDGVLVLWRVGGGEDYLGSAKRAYSRHQGKANVVFCDGHVESPSLRLLFEDTSDAALTRWNRDHQPHRERLPP